MKTFVLLFTLALLVMPAAATVAGTQGDNDVSFNGSWKTIAGGTHQYTVTLKQVGKKVTGSYSPGNGKIFDGVVDDNKLTFKWTQDGGYEGTGEFTMDEDGKNFTGNSTALKPQEFTVTWNTYKPEAASFAGNWQTTSDGQNSVPLTIVQNGNKVTGLYPSSNGKLEGTVTGKVLRFKWESDGGSGSGRFVMEESNQAFSGTYNRGDDPDEVEATWNGVHAGYSGGKAPTVSFAGEWTLKWKGSNPLYIGQAGSKVKGYCNTDRQSSLGTYSFQDTVVGNTLRFKLTRRIINTVIDGQFVMDEGGKSFKGTIDGVAVTGTFVKPVQFKDKDLEP